MSSVSLDVDALLYGYVKEKNPCLLIQMFTKEKCRELEKTDHLYDPATVSMMLRKYRENHMKPVDQNDNDEVKTEAKKGISMPAMLRKHRETDAKSATQIKKSEKKAVVKNTQDSHLSRGL